MKIRLLMTITILMFGAAACHASWLVYHKPEFKGQVVDLETNEPIEGAVVVAIYKKKDIGPADAVITNLHAQETLTDKDGKFSIPSYSTMISPLSLSFDVEFIIFKPGYVWERPVHLERTLSGQGVADFDMPTMWDHRLKIVVLNNGIIKIPKIRTDEDRVKSFRSMGQVSNFKNELPIASSVKEKERSNILKLKY